MREDQVAERHGDASQSQNTFDDRLDRDVATTNAPASGLDHYRRHVAHLGLSDAQERDMLAALHLVVQSFVDRAFGDDAVQLAQNAGDRLQDVQEANGGSVIDSPDIQSDNDQDLSQAFGASAAPQDGGKR